MDLSPAGTNTVAYNHPFGHVVAGRVFEVPFEEVYDQVAEGRVPVPFHCLAGHSNATEAVSVPMVQRFVMMEDLNLEIKKRQKIN
jgi:hypothetical protein